MAIRSQIIISSPLPFLQTSQTNSKCPHLTSSHLNSLCSHRQACRIHLVSVSSPSTHSYPFFEGQPQPPMHTQPNLGVLGGSLPPLTSERPMSLGSSSMGSASIGPPGSSISGMSMGPPSSMGPGPMGGNPGFPPNPSPSMSVERFPSAAQPRQGKNQTLISPSTFVRSS